MRIRADDAMGLGGGAGDVAGELRRGDRRRQRGKELRLRIAVLDFKRAQSIVRPSSRGGVPVFNRARAKPAASRLCASETDA